MRYYDAAGKRRRKACGSREEADFERARIVLDQSRNGAAPAAITASRAPVVDEPGLTIAAFWEPWIADARTRLQRATIKEYERVVVTRIEPRFGSLELDALKPRMVSQWRLAELVGAGTGPEAIRRAMTLL
ncbi:MAG: Phage integrase, N-terminal SAM-like domain [Thermoleophilaceae bacterium]|nr:Phage integrase, N-terminal SAM-like domain [Thermoleophilaceae bacterium]